MASIPLFLLHLFFWCLFIRQHMYYCTHLYINRVSLSYILYCSLVTRERPCLAVSIKHLLL